MIVPWVFFTEKMYWFNEVRLCQRCSEEAVMKSADVVSQYKRERAREWDARQVIVTLISMQCSLLWPGYNWLLLRVTLRSYMQKKWRKFSKQFPDYHKICHCNNFHFWLTLCCASWESSPQLGSSFIETHYLAETTSTSKLHTVTLSLSA